MKNTNRFCRYTALCILAAGIFPLSAFSQKKDNLGKEFYIAFAQNQGSGDETKNFMALFIAAKVPTKGIVEVTTLRFRQNFTVTPGKITTIELPDGKIFGDSTVEVFTDEQVLPGMAVHITADDEVSVYGINHKQWSSDAFMALPVDVLGTTYRTANYQTSWPTDISGNAVNTPGEFWIVGVTNATNVTITPRAATANGSPAGIPFKVQLNTGDVFLVQGDLNDSSNDLTGSLIESDQPVAVLSGHVRTDIPHGFKNAGIASTSRDHLVEQMPPVSSWGYSALIASYSSSLLPDLVRIISHDNQNKISVNGTLAATINAGEFYEITQLTDPVSIQSSNPILVGQYMHTSKYGTSGPGTAYGDPAYALVFPIEQFDTSYTFMVDPDPVAFSGNFVNVVTCESGFTDMMLDDKPISSFSGFTVQKFPGSIYAYAQIRIEQGDHKISGPLPFGITVYAFGQVDSYAYPGGSLIDSSGAGSRNIEYAVSSKRIINDTVGATIYLPIYLKSSSKISSLDLAMHYPTPMLTYQRSILPSGKNLDIPGEQWSGRTKLHWDGNDIAALADSLAGYCIFTWNPREVECATIVFDSMVTAAAEDPCSGKVQATPLYPVATGHIGTSPNCGQADITDDLTLLRAEEVIFRPNPAKDFATLTTSRYSGPLSIEFVNVLGIPLKKQVLLINANTQLTLDLGALPEGVYYLNISCDKFSKVIPFVHLR